jgi:hypothetical protein
VTPHQRRARGIAASALLNDATLQMAWAELEDELRTQWEAAWLPRKRDRIWTELRHLRAMRQKLANYASHAPRD